MPQAQIEVRVQPKARRNDVEVVDEQHLKVWVTSPAEGGRANAAATILLARRLKVPKSAVSIVRGHKSRNKVVAVEGIEMDDLLRRLAKGQ